ncbi:MAG: helix-turn-helix domain-containing protein, partial [Halieaceae bacterium]|jgi:DNA-binding HxlR family transcriptional regulator|nr:helix-turn-helix domain-containing protein [Halieaceae bacterium]
MEYGQFCPVAKAAELLGEKWTLLIVRELLYGSTRFSEFQRAISGISPTMLNKRLKELESNGLVEKDDHDYQLTPAGKDLAPLVRQFAIWGMRWGRGNLPDCDLDVDLLLWDIRRRIKTEFLPETGAVIEVHITDLPDPSRWWLSVEACEARPGDRDVQLSTEPPRTEVDLAIDSSLRALTEIWLGDITLHTALVRRQLTLQGMPLLIRSIERWLPLARNAVFSERNLNPSAENVRLSS